MNCPYCNKVFNNWKSVRAHASRCSKLDYSYLISLEYGPISYEEIQQLTQREFKDKYPKFSREAKANISKTLRKHGYTFASEWTHDKAKQSALKFACEQGRNPTSRDTYKTLWLPTDNWCKKEFGSWNNFLEFCGLDRNEQSYGIKTRALDGQNYLSTLEAKFVDKFLFGRLDYEYEKAYPNNSGRICDFYLPQLDLYIEIAGGLRPEVIAEKIAFCKRDNINLKVIYPKDLDKDFHGLASGF